MNIIITGANGFIGEWLIKDLIRQEPQHHITALIRNGSQFKNCEEDSRVSVKEVDYGQNITEEVFRNQDVCIHLIGQMGEYGLSRRQYEDVNVMLTIMILNWCEHMGVKQFVFCSTPGVQGFGHRLAVETEGYAPRNNYERTKMVAEQKIIQFCQKANIKYTIIRPDFVYGPNDVRRVKMYKNIKNGKFVLTTNGKSYLHPTYILDVTQGFRRVIGNPNAYNEIFNISSAADVTSLQYLQTIAGCVQRRLIHINIGYRISICLARLVEWIYTVWLKKEAFVSKDKIDFLSLNHSTSNKKAMERIGYKPEFDIKQGMQQTIEWCVAEKLI